MSAKNLKLLNQYVEKLLTLDQQDDDPELTQRIEILVGEAANSLKSLRIGYLQEMKLGLMEQENQLHRDKEELDTRELQRFKYSDYIITEAIKRRKESHRKPNYPMNRNLLDHGVYWAGGRSKAKGQLELMPSETKVIKIDKDGIKALMYQNDRGQLLSLFDTKVFLGLHKIWDKNGRKQEFTFTSYELLDTINLGKSATHYEMLNESLETLYATSVVMKEFYIKGEQRHIITDKFHLMEGHRDHEIQNLEGEKIKKTHRIVFSKYLQDSISEGFVSYISLAMLEDLQTDVAQALYLMMNSMTLSKDCYYELRIEKICKHIGIDENQRPSRIKTTLLQACEQLSKTEIIVDYVYHTDEYKNRYLRLYPSDWFVSLHGNTVPSLGSRPHLVHNPIFEAQF